MDYMIMYLLYIQCLSLPHNALAELVYHIKYYLEISHFDALQATFCAI